MAEITVPDHDELRRVTPTLSAPAQANYSGWTGGRKVVGQPGIETWRGKIAIPDMTTEAEERPWRAFVFALKNQANWFRYKLPCADHVGNKPIVGDGPSNGYTLPLSGMTPSRTILEAGQYMTVPLPSGRLRAVCLTADLITNGSGQALAQFQPALSEIPAEGVTVETKDPFIPMSPVLDALPWDGDDGISSFGFDVEEFR